MALKRGFLPFTIAALGAIFTGTMIIGIGLVFLVTKVHIDINLKFEYEKSFSDLAMLSLLRLKYNSTYSAYRVLAERGVNGFDSNMQKFLSDKIGLIAATDCFRLANSTFSILQTSGCEAYEEAGEAFIFKPYNSGNLVEEMTLTYNKVKK
jgi:hypothetical protein